MRFPDLGRQLVLRERGFDSRAEIAAVRVIVDMLQLAPAAVREVTAWRLLMVRTRGKRSIAEQRIPSHSERHVAPARRHPVSAGSDADDFLVH
jgi:hypothetical protein